MSASAYIKTSLEVGFAEGALPAEYLALRGKQTRAIPVQESFPFADAQFEVVMMASNALLPVCIREAHRVLLPTGRLFFTAPEKTSKQEGFTLPQLYSLVRDGFNLTKVERVAWWQFWRHDRFLHVCAEKKVWRPYKGFFCVGRAPLSPFHEFK